MRPRSMTGFGRDEVIVDERTWTVEVRTVNHRFLDLRIMLPKGYTALEERVRRLVNAYHDRGRVEVCLQQQGQTSLGSVLNVDMDLAAQYANCLRGLNEQLNLNDKISLSDMLTLKELIGHSEQSPDLDAEWEIISMALTGALDACNCMREQEGTALKEELLERLEVFSGYLAEIESAVPEILETRKNDLQARIEKLLDGVDLDPARLAMETAILVDKYDITEELVRLRSHVDQFTLFIDSSEEPVGRRLDFLLQEFLREVNTISSKISNGRLAHLTVEMKNEIERLREQVQNIE